LKKTEAEWRAQLSPDEYHVTREEQEDGKTIIRYAGSDGVLYESIRGEGWTAIARVPQASKHL
jgi:hypothetical protein